MNKQNQNQKRINSLNELVFYATMQPILKTVDKNGNVTVLYQNRGLKI